MMRWAAGSITSTACRCVCFPLPGYMACQQARCPSLSLAARRAGVCMLSIAGGTACQQAPRPSLPPCPSGRHSDGHHAYRPYPGHLPRYKAEPSLMPARSRRIKRLQDLCQEGKSTLKEWWQPCFRRSPSAAPLGNSTVPQEHKRRRAARRAHAPRSWAAAPAWVSVMRCCCVRACACLRVRPTGGTYDT